MNRLYLVALWAVVALAACTPPGAQTSTDIPALSNLWAEAFNTGDLDALVDMYMEDARILPPNAEIGQGHAAIRASFGEMIAAGLQGELETIEAVVAGDIGYHVGSYTLQSPDGAVIDRGKFIEVWRQEAGEWKIANDIWNSDTPSAAQGVSTVSITTHEVEDAEHWLAAWQGPDSRHELFAQHGAVNVRVFQSQDNPNLTGLLVDVADMEAFQAFMSSPEAEAAKTADGVKDATLRVFMEVK